MGSGIWTARWDPGRPVLIRPGRINLSPPEQIRNRPACGEALAVGEVQRLQRAEVADRLGQGGEALAAVDTV